MIVGMGGDVAEGRVMTLVSALHMVMEMGYNMSTAISW